jgi:hypothetical protein
MSAFLLEMPSDHHVRWFLNLRLREAWRKRRMARTLICLARSRETPYLSPISFNVYVLFVPMPK